MPSAPTQCCCVLALLLDVFYFLSFGYRVETVRTHYKQPTNIKTCTTLYYISVLLVSVVWILSICRFPTVFPKYLRKLKKRYVHQFLSFDVFYYLSFGYRVETVRTHYKRRTNIKTYTTLYYISVLLVSVVWILSICHFSTVFPEIFVKSSKSNIYIRFELRCVLLSLFWLSSGNCAHILQATCKHQNVHNVILY